MSCPPAIVTQLWSSTPVHKPRVKTQEPTEDTNQKMKKQVQNLETQFCDITEGIKIQRTLQEQIELENMQLSHSDIHQMST